MLRRLRPHPAKEIPFIIFSSFLGLYLVARIFIYLIPDAFLNVKGVHVHHFAYGFIILTLVGFYNLVCQPRKTSLKVTASFFGIGMALAYDEFGMWLQLKDYGVARYGYDAVIVITLVLLNVIYFSNFWDRNLRRLSTAAFKSIRLFVLNYIPNI